MSDDTDYRHEFLSRASELGWEIIFEDNEGLQLKRKKTYVAEFAYIGLIFNLVALCAYLTTGSLGRFTAGLLGLGVLLWCFGFMDYLRKSDAIIYVKRSELMGIEHAPKLKSLLES
ncbi:hypothetical protein [Coraliomargarita parva]|uniref:hypothetical protein n=1 Tax=Coraliomargarita parva TaxID=3014050 RepID=UPI0022B4189D|nr:hypothetical protein [Coraliomargarita parva]